MSDEPQSQTITGSKTPKKFFGGFYRDPCSNDELKERDLDEQLSEQRFYQWRPISRNPFEIQDEKFKVPQLDSGVDGGNEEKAS
jgi:hypothetical protein